MNEERRRRVELQLRKYFSHNQEDSYLQTITAAVVMLYCHTLIQAQCGRNAVLSYTRRTMKEQ